MTGNGRHIPPIKMVMTGGWFMKFFHINGNVIGMNIVYGENIMGIVHLCNGNKSFPLY